MADFILIVNAINNEERVRMNFNRRELRDASDPFSLTEETFKGIYRLSRQLTQDLMLNLSPFLRDNERVLGIPKHLRVKLTNFIYLSSTSYKYVLDFDYFTLFGSRVLSKGRWTGLFLPNESKVSEQMCRGSAEKTEEKQLFMTMPHGFPGIIGAIDCTHISIISPPVEDPQYPAIAFLNRKGYYSINVQIICNAHLKILAINARYPGSVHDSGIWTTSDIKQVLRNAYQNGDTSSWLIGDAGYPLEPWLMTPISGQNLTEAERRYNSAHKTVRNVIERLNGVLKTRFRCYNPPKCAKVIYACAILHNVHT
ncbi:putative nuclease HARBI1 isoform X2 [Photinus pyralis]|uniref:putative nuclease HARBI1 isoform X2 n=1 Tax=Photinus pyralis TaxID=7054 RepID=UPI001266FBBF|nr:putative nuclease HARBI1 isoform X2 [Photinus pyralis]